MALIIVEETEASYVNRQFWWQMFIIVDVICCIAVILPVVWFVAAFTIEIISTLITGQYDTYKRRPQQMARRRSIWRSFDCSDTSTQLLLAMSTRRVC